MKAVILSGGEGALLMPLTKYSPATMLPILNTPLLEHTLRFLRGMGIKEIAIALGKKSSNIVDHFGNGSLFGVQLQYVFDEYPQGTAGALRQLGSFLHGEPFIVISGSTFLYGADLSNEIFKAMALHIKRNAVATVLVSSEEKEAVLESIQFDGPETIKQFHILHPSKDRRQSQRFYGIYIFNPEVIQAIPGHGYIDIKEQLLPILQSRGTQIQSHQMAGNRRRSLQSVEDYYLLNRSLLMDLFLPIEREMLDRSYYKVLDRVWVGENVRISPTAYLLGPLVIGGSSEIGDHAQVIGPAVLGRGTKVGKHALLRESLSWDHVVLEEGAEAQYCILESSLVVKKDEIKARSVVTREPLATGDFNFVRPEPGLFATPDRTSPSFPTIFKRWFFSAAKQMMDLVCSGLGLLLFSPLMLLVAIAIKLDSKGPIFFAQRRCGRGGKEFKMLKFRTMVTDAEQMQKALYAKKDVDGPMFKLIHDPRITRVGRILRKTSLDELPQLYNVFVGDMSLVGPRPLIMEEMRFSPSWRNIRLKVKPGVTGLWQVNGRSQSYFHDWIRYDIEYVRKQSLVLDMKIIALTALRLVRAIGAY